MRCLSLPLVVLLFAPLGAAEPGAVITGSGSAVVKSPPGVMRLSMKLSASGKTLEEALAALKERREAATVALKKLEADPKSVEFGDPTPAVQGEQRDQLRRMVRGLRSSSGKAPRGLQVPESATVECELTAEWPLKFKDADELLIVSKTLQEKVREAELGGAKAAQKGSPEEAELAEELEMSQNEQGPKPGEPTFTFVAYISEKERAQAEAEAFAKAKAAAARTAIAAGGSLGELTELVGRSAPLQDSEDYGGDYRTMQRMRASAKSEDEAVSATPSSVRFQFSAEAKFRLKP